MVLKSLVRSGLILSVVAVMCSGSVFAQRAEIYPNMGFFWPDTMNTGERLKSDGIYGLKGGVFMGQNAQLEGSFGYINHFEMRNPAVDMPTRGFLYDVNTVYNFGQRQFLNARISPFISVGAGGLTTKIPNDTASAFAITDSSDTFLTLNYGAGVKFLNVAGPMGLRFDVRGRTLPNFRGETTTWFEPTAGLTFSWGER